MGQVFVGGLFPPGGPDQVESGRQPLQMERAAGGYVVHHAVDGMQAPWRATLERRISGGQPVAFPESEQADDPVHIEEKDRLLSLIGHKESVTNVRSSGRLGSSVQTVVENSAIL